ncbi:MAG: hypothetical protein EXQ92_08890, partial [Alphaproteobacteria bacterium]|nr:hypothetical protein [Alphaproteobacteria bacterium]
QSEAARRLGVEQPRVSEIINARLAGFSKDRLIELALRLSTDVRITLAEAKGRSGLLHCGISRRRIGAPARGIA